MSKKIVSMMSILSALSFSPALFGDAPKVVEVEQEVKKSFNDRVKETRIFVSQVVQENGETLSLFDRLQADIVKAYGNHKLDDAEVDLILEGIEFATDRHKEQVRRNKEKSPYITHPLRVTLSLMEKGKVTDARVIVAALLHDTVRDGVAKSEEIEKRFGSQVASYVAEMTDDKEISRADRKRKQIIEAAKQSAGAAQIKLADQLCNLEELRMNPPEDWSRARIDEYYQWAQAVIDRLPSANPELKKATSEAIEGYWHSQEAAKKR